MDHRKKLGKPPIYQYLGHGTHSGRFFRNEAHMGGEASYMTVVRWILTVLDNNVDPAEAIRELDYKPKY
jgi:hypothetical protein